jgi:ATP-dependent protease ClpP protease subunit
MPQNNKNNANKKLVNIVNSVDDNTMLLYGNIGRYDEIDWESFQEAFNRLDNGNDIVLRINCMGGETFEAFAMYDRIRNAKSTVIGINEGIAASSGFVLFLACDKRKMTSNARLMTHRVSGGCYGEEEDLREYADVMKSENERLVTILKERSGKDEATVNEWLKRGTNTWFNAKEAMANGLCHEEVQSDKATNNTLPSTPPKNEDETWQMFRNCSTIETQTKDSDMKNLQAALVLMLVNAGYSVTHESNETELTNALNDFKAKNEAKLQNLSKLENSFKEINNKRAAELIANAKKLGKLTNLDDTQTASWVKKAVDNYDMVNELLDMKEATPGLPNINNSLDLGKPNAGTTTTTENTAYKETWTLDKWEQDDPKGLAEMMRNDMAKYEKLFKNHYGVDFPVK